GYWPNIYDDQSYENQWGVGKHQFTVSILGVEGTCEVEVVENPIASITAVEHNTLIEGYSGGLSYDYNEETDEYDLEYFQYGISDETPIYTVTFKNGTVITGTVWEISEETGCWPQIYSDQSYENQWGIGKHQVTVELLGVEGSFEVEVIENPIASITAVAQNTLIEGVDGSLAYEWDDENDCETEGYWIYSIWDVNPIFTVTYKNGTVYTGGFWEIEEQTGYWVNWDSNQSYENQWGVGKHQFTIEMLGVEGTCEIEVVESPIVSITAVAQRDLIQNADGYWNSAYNEETDEYDLEYFKYSINAANPVFTVTFKDGTVVTGDRWDIENATGYWVEIEDDQSYENQWGIGKHEFTIEILGVQGTGTVTITDTPIASITAVAQDDLIQYADGYWDAEYNEETDEWDLNEYYYYYIDRVNPIFTVTYKDGTVVTGDREKISEATGYWVEIEDDQSYENQWGIGKHSCTINFLGAEGQLEVNIVPTPVAKVTVDEVKIIEETSGYWYVGSDDKVSYGYYIDPEYTVTFKDGTTVRSENGYIEYNNRWYYLNIKGDNSLSVGKHTLNAKALGADCTVNVEIVETPIKSVTITPSRDLIEGVDYYYYHLDLLDYNAVIKYKDGKTETVKLSEFLQKNNAYVYSNVEGVIDGTGKYTVDFRLMGVSTDVNINVVENPYESISISGKNELNITFHKKDGTTVVAKATNFTETYEGSYDTYLEGIIETDKGNFIVGVDYDVENNDVGKNIAIHLGQMKSNKLTRNNFVKAYTMFDDTLFAISLQSSYSKYLFDSEFNGYNANSKINVDEVIGLAAYVKKYHYWSDDAEYDYYNGYWCAGVSVNTAKNIVNEVFGITINPKDAKLYDKETGLVYIPVPEGYGDAGTMEYYITTSVNFVDGKWVCTKTLNYYTGEKESTKVVFTEGFVIEEISFASSESCAHNNTEVRDAVEPDYGVDGYTGDTYCVDCGELIAEGEVVEKLYYKSKTYTGLYKVSGKWRYVKNGELDNTFTGLVKYSGKWYHVKAGVKTTYTGLVKHTDGKYYYVKSGVKTSFNGLVKYNGKWYYVKDGVKTTYTGLVKHTDGKYYYVKNGVKTSFNGLVKYNSKWYHVKDGVKTTYTGLVKHTDGKYYYVKSGVKTSFNGLVKYNGKWYYVKSGVVNTSYTGLVKHTDGKYYYVKKGVKTSYTGTVTYNGKKYKVKNGVKV
ncbi:MAG: hypothetical protein IKW45_07600, partial [Clostridia bacterium]|nr:hypothetical protein [Clostridia bacterium]